MPKRLGTNMLASQGKKSRYSSTNVTSRNLRAMLPRVVIPETHYVDFTDQNVLTETVCTASLNVISIGNQKSQRIGDKLTITGIDLTLRYKDACRLSILIPKDPTVVPTALDPTTRYSHNDFTIIHEKVLSPSVNGENALYHFKKKMNLPRQYQSNNNSVVRTGSLYVMVNSVLPGATGDLKLVTRLYWVG